MKTKKETNKKGCTSTSTNETRRFSKTWLAALKSQGCLIVTDPNLM
ncbi:MAG: hypothetical protein IKA83_07030 [Paludibacteraceae bacterium]|jgi:hypothetical protein|nr:hypothetical protein [Paludibacteraceae bacterium]